MNTERVNVKILKNIHDKMVSLCSKLNLKYVGNGNINPNLLFKDSLHLVESGKTILANKRIFNLNYFLFCTNQLNALI